MILIYSRIAVRVIVQSKAVYFLRIEGNIL